MSRTFLVIHGGWTRGAAWAGVAAALERLGHQVLAPDLPGRGADATPMGALTLERYVDAVVAALEGLDRPVVLVGHSSGGIVVSRAAELRPERVQRLVYVCAYLPRDGESLMALAQRHPEDGILPHLVPSSDGATVRIAPDAVRRLLFEDCPPEAADAELARFTAGEPVALAVTPVRLTAARFGRIPKAYVECAHDRAIPPSLQRDMHTSAGCDVVVTMATGHMPHLAAPELLARHLAAL